MRWRLDHATRLRNTARIALILAVAAFGSLVVRNVTDMLMGISYRPAPVLAADTPQR